jgi:hypothetical protein
MGEKSPGETYLLVADAHEYGPGKIHILADAQRTLCGRARGQCPGEIRVGYEDEVTCQLCARSWVATKHQKEREQRWREQNAQWQAERRQATRDGRFGIATEHRFTRFRSRLEARWAVFFDAIGWRWEYEPFDLDGYIPDFAILGARPFLIEVKPAVAIDELREHIAKAGRAHRDLLIVGATPFMPGTYGGDSGTAGLMIQWNYGAETPAPEDATAEAAEWAEEARWHRCGEDGCGGIAVHHTIGWFVGYPCGHYDGDGYLGPAPLDALERVWADARNRTQWESA